MIRRIFFILAFLVLVDAASGKDERSIKNLSEALAALAPDVDPGEAELVSVTAHTTARRLAKEWRVVPPAMFQNFLIHIGARDHGFCFHWAYGIGAQLKELRLKTLVLHWGAAYAGGRLEHNCVVVTARGQLFRDGYIIDGWRNAGRLCWWPVKKDDYPWKEDLRETAWLQNYGPSEQKAQNATVQR